MKAQTHTNKKMILSDPETGQQIELDIRLPTIGPPAIDIRKLFNQLGYFTYDPGYISTASCSSAITYMDGEKGQLMYRGYPIAVLAERSNYLETCYLLYYGDLPNQEQLNNYTLTIAKHTILHEALKSFFSGFRRDAHPMAIMTGVVGALSSFYHDHMNIHSEDDREAASHHLIAKMPTIAAWSYRYAKGLPFVYPDNSLNYTENFLYMMFSVPMSPYKQNKDYVRALDLILLLHADHEQNASTSTVRLSGSSEANPFAAIASGIASLWGPAHGGANEAVILMLQDIINSGKPIEHYINRAKDKSDSFRLMGFGHRVYKTYDPRAKIIRQMCHDMLEKQQDPLHQELLNTAMKLEQIAINDDYFKSRNLYPNVDFYSGVILLAMGIPLTMFTVIFAMARTIGWISHWNEMMSDEKARIARPRQVYIGEPERDYPPISER